MITVRKVWKNIFIAQKLLYPLIEVRQLILVLNLRHARKLFRKCIRRCEILQNTFCVY